MQKKDRRAREAELREKEQLPATQTEETHHNEREREHTVDRQQRGDKQERCLVDEGGEKKRDNVRMWHTQTE